MIVGHIGGGSVGGYQVQRSVRMRPAASAWFSKSFGSSGNLQKFTQSAWVKRGRLGVDTTIFYAFNGGATTSYFFKFDAADRLQAYSAVEGVSTNWNVISAARYRDVSAWYHVMVAVDTTQATASDRVKLYVNGTQITALDAASYPSQNFNNVWNATGYQQGVGRSGEYDGYMAEVYAIDGQALTPTSFAEQDSATRMWVPKSPARVRASVAVGGGARNGFGANGFYLPFSDITSTTTLGYDRSQSDTDTTGNNWTANNISLTSGVTYDSMLDVPGLPWADGGNGRGNYATLNPLWGTNSAGNTYSDGNLKLSTNGSSSSGQARSTISLPETGKFYCEMRPTNFVCSTSGTSTGQYGILAASESKQIAIRTVSSASSSLTSAAIYKDNVLQTSITTPSLNDVFGFAVDCGAGTVQIFINNVSVWSGSYSVTSEPFFFGFAGDSGTSDRDSVTEFNFGQRPFAYTPPTGFKALNTANLPDPTGAAAKPWEHFDVVTRAGTSASANITSLSFQPDLFWGKARNSASYGHRLIDSVRGATKQLLSHTADAESTDTGGLTAFTSNGYSLGSSADYNASTITYVNWLWKAGGAAVSNTAGSITSQVSANTSAGFSIVTYTGTGANATVGHGLGVAPKMVIVKNRDGSPTSWGVWHSALAVNEGLELQSTGAKQTGLSVWWNGATPTSTLFSIGTSGTVNGNTQKMVAYCFAEIPGFSKFGSISMNSSADGAFFDTGFDTALLMMKRTDAASNWIMLDTVRQTYNVMGPELYPNLSNAESVVTELDFTARGIKFRNSGLAGTWIIAAWARSPFKYANSR